MPTTNNATSWHYLELEESTAQISHHQSPKLGRSTRSTPGHGLERRDEAGRAHGGRFDPNGDRSLSPPPLGPRPFSRHILRALVQQLYRPNANITKYSRESTPKLWLGDYGLACHAGGADHNDFIFCNLPLYLADSA